MVCCPFNSREWGNCFVTAQGRTRVILLVLGRRPLLGWRAWRYYSSLIMIVDDIGGLVGSISCPPIPGVVHTLDGRRNMRRFVYFRTDAHTWLGVTRYFTYIYIHTYIYIYIYIYLLLLLLFFFFFFKWCLGLCSALMAYWRGTRCGHVFDFDWLGSLVSGGNLFSFPAFSKAKGLVIFIFPFASPFLLLLSYFPSVSGFSNFLSCAFRPLSSQFPPNFKVRPLFKLFSFLNFLSFEFFFSLFLCIFLC